MGASISISLAAVLGSSGCGAGLDTDHRPEANRFQLYVESQGSQALFAFTGDGSTGALEPVGTYPVSGGSVALAADPGGRVLLHASGSPAFNLTTYAIESTGSLSLRQSGGNYAVSSYGAPSTWAVSPGSGRAYLLTSTGYAASLTYDAVSGAIQAQVAPTLLLSFTNLLAAFIHPDTGYAYVATTSNIRVATQAGGSLIPGAGLSSAGSSIAFDATGDEFFTLSSSSGVRAITGLISNPGSPALGPPVSTPGSLKRLGVFERGRRMLSVSDNGSAGQLTVHAILAVSPFLASTPVASMPAGVSTQGLIIDQPTGLVYVSDCASNQLYGYRLHDDGSSEVLAGFPMTWTGLWCPGTLAIARPPR